MIVLLLLPFSLCALAARISGHPIDGGLTRWTDLSASVAYLTSTGLHSLNRRTLSIDLNEAPTHKFDLNEEPIGHFDLEEMTDSDGVPEHQHPAKGKSLHAGVPASPRESQNLLSHPVTPFPAAREPAGEPSSVPWMGWGRRKSSKSAGLHPSTEALPMNMDHDTGSSNHAVAFPTGKEVDNSRTSKQKARSKYNARYEEKRKILGYKRKEILRDEDKGRNLEEVKASLSNPSYTPTARQRTRADHDARYAEKKRVLGYKWSQNLRDEHKNKGLSLEVVNIRQGLDPSVSVPSRRPRKNRKDGLDSHRESSEEIALRQAATRDAQRKAWNDIADSVLNRPGKRTRANSHRI